MKKPNFWNSISSVPANAVIVAKHSPGFSSNLSKWRLIIDEEGNLYQGTDVWEWSEEKNIVQERRAEQTHIGTDEVTRLLKMANEVLRQPILEPDAMMTDAATNIILVRVGESLQQVSPDAEGFFELWREVHNHAPYSPN